MTNQSIYAAFERMWQHIISALSNKANKSTVYTKTEANTKITTFLNRSTAVNTADANYTTLMARGTSLNSTGATPNVNGAIAWIYE